MDCVAQQQLSQWTSYDTDMSADPYYYAADASVYLPHTMPNNAYMYSNHPSSFAHQTPADMAYDYYSSNYPYTDNYTVPSPTYPLDDPWAHQLIHAPVPISSYSTLLPNITSNMSSSSLGDPDSTANDRAPTVPQQISPSSSSRQFSPVVQARDSNCVPKLESEEIWEPNPLEIYGNVPQVMFPTPCELLAELAEQDQSTSKTRRVAAPVASSSSMGPRSPSRASTSRKCSTRAVKSHQDKAGKTRSSSSPTVPVVAHIKAKPENIRKSYFRAVADYVGFKPTDPDTITSHDKKRQYLETLEQYIIWLHDQIKLVGQTPMPMQRVDTCRELSSDSVRTILVHLQDDSRRIHGVLKAKGNPGIPL